jgi:hypothetical protein
MVGSLGFDPPCIETIVEAIENNISIQWCLHLFLCVLYVNSFISLLQSSSVIELTVFS